MKTTKTFKDMKSISIHVISNPLDNVANMSCRYKQSLLAFLTYQRENKNITCYIN